MRSQARPLFRLLLSARKGELEISFNIRFNRSSLNSTEGRILKNLGKLGKAWFGNFPVKACYTCFALAKPKLYVQGWIGLGTIKF